jgi:hypothetical protein
MVAVKMCWAELAWNVKQKSDNEWISKQKVIKTKETGHSDLFKNEKEQKTKDGTVQLLYEQHPKL